jgi:hypothetical protein
MNTYKYVQFYGFALSGSRFGKFDVRHIGILDATGFNNARRRDRLKGMISILNLTKNASVSSLGTQTDG